MAAFVMKCREGVGWLVDWMASMKQKFLPYLPKLCTVHLGTQASNCGSQDSCGIWLSLSFAFLHSYAPLHYQNASWFYHLEFSVDAWTGWVFQWVELRSQDHRSRVVRLNLYCVDKQPTDRAVAKCLWHGLSSARQKGSIPFCEDALHSSPSHASHDLFFASNTLPGGKRMVSGWWLFRRNHCPIPAAQLQLRDAAAQIHFLAHWKLGSNEPSRYFTWGP